MRPGRGSRVELALVGIAHVFVLAILLWHWSSLSEHIVDIPVADDWRQLRPGPYRLPAELDLSWIFLSANKTVYATGKLLDYFYFATTAGSYAAYQRITCAVVLGLVVLTSFRLLARVGLTAPWRVLGVLATAFFLQIRSYWGISALAYHQALPVIGVLVTLLLLTNERQTKWRGPALFIVGLAAGLAYVSGAVAIFSLGVYLCAAALWFRRTAGAAGLLSQAAVVMAAGVMAFGLQLALVETLPLPSRKLATPLDWQFWHFLAHQGARAVGMLSSDGTAVLRGMLATVLIFGVTGIAVVRGALRARGDVDRRTDRVFVIVAGGLLVAVASYLVVVSYGRAAPHQHATALELAAAAKARFHYWWVTALLPWAAIAPYFIRRRRGGEVGAFGNGRVSRWVVPAATACMLLALQSPASWSFGTHYERQAERRDRGIRCLARGYRQRGPVSCPDLVALRDRNLRPHIDFARARSFPFAKRFD